MSIQKKLQEATKLTDKAEGDFVKAIEGQYQTALFAIREQVAKAANYDKFDQVEMAKYNRLTNLQERIKKELVFMDGMKESNLRQYLVRLYEQNYYYTGFALETEGQVKLSYSLINRQAVANAIITLMDKIALENNAIQVTQALKSTIAQAVIQGLTVKQTAEMVKANLEKNANNAVRIARTETARVRNQARFDSMEHAQSKGLPLVKVWLATLDTRTRDTHATLDGEKRELDEPFSNGLMFPGDPSGDPAEIINCRCDMLTEIKGLDYSGLTRRVRGEEEPIPYKTYNEWVKNRVKNSEDNGPTTEILKVLNKPLEKQYGKTESINANYIRPVNAVTDEIKYNALIADFEMNGYNGRPILAEDLGDGEYQALTGSHRILAAQNVGIDLPIKVIEIPDEYREEYDNVSDDSDRLKFVEKLYKDKAISEDELNLMIDELEINEEEWRIADEIKERQEKLIAQKELQDKIKADELKKELEKKKEPTINEDKLAEFRSFEDAMLKKYGKDLYRDMDDDEIDKLERLEREAYKGN